MFKYIILLISFFLCSCIFYDSNEMSVFTEQDKIYWEIKSNPELLNKSLDQLKELGWFSNYQEPQRTNLIEGSIKLYKNRDGE